MARKNQALLMVLLVLVVLGFVFRKYAGVGEFGEDRVFWIGCASILTLVAARFFAKRGGPKNKS